MTTNRHLTFTAVTKTLNQQTVVPNLTLTIPLEGATILAGPSGSGKSVICRLGVGLLAPDAGQITLLDTSMTSSTERMRAQQREQVPYIVQGHALLDWLTIEQNIEIARPGAGQELVDEVIDAVGIGAFRHLKPREVGPGTRKRAAIARALALRPLAMILDEPTTGLDRAASAHVTQTLRTLRDAGVGLVVISHDLALMQTLGDRVIEIRDGQVGYMGHAAPFVEALKDSNG